MYLQWKNLWENFAVILTEKCLRTGNLNYFSNAAMELKLAVYITMQRKVFHVINSPWFFESSKFCGIILLYEHGQWFHHVLETLNQNKVHTVNYSIYLRQSSQKKFQFNIPYSKCVQIMWCSHVGEQEQKFRIEYCNYIADFHVLSVALCLLFTIEQIFPSFDILHIYWNLVGISTMGQRGHFMQSML